MTIDRVSHLQNQIDPEVQAIWAQRTMIDPVHHLLIAVMEQAWLDLQTSRRRGWRKEESKVLRWFATNDEELFGFVAICQYLDIPPDRIRKHVKAIRHMG